MTRLGRTPTRDSLNSALPRVAHDALRENPDEGQHRRPDAGRGLSTDTPVMTTWACPMANLPEVQHPPGVLED